MNRDDVISIAIECGLYSGNPRTPGTENMIVGRLERFAIAVEAITIERAARMLIDEQWLAAAALVRGKTE